MYIGAWQGSGGSIRLPTTITFASTSTVTRTMRTTNSLHSSASYSY